MARHWGLPEEFAVLVGGHSDVDRWTAQAASHPAELAVAMSALLPGAADPSWRECAVLEDHYRRVVPADGPALAMLLAQIDDESRPGPSLESRPAAHVPGRALCGGDGSRELQV